jgi:hypothetical protein
MDTDATDKAFAEKLTELEAAHGRIGVVTSSDGRSWCVVLRKPKRAEYKMFRANASHDMKRTEAQETFFKQTCVWPATPVEVEALLDEWPGIPEACSGTIMSLAGMSGAEQGKL